MNDNYTCLSYQCDFALTFPSINQQLHCNNSIIKKTLSNITYITMRKPNAKEEEEEVDPLDAYMSSLAPTTAVSALTTTTSTKSTSSNNNNNHVAAAAAAAASKKKAVTFEEIMAQLNGENDNNGNSNEQHGKAEADDEEDGDKFLKSLLDLSAKKEKEREERLRKEKAEEITEREDEQVDPTSARDMTEAVLDILNTKAKKKEIKPVDHATMNYEPFTKNFYIESPLIKNLSKEEVSVILSSLEIKIRGQKPINKPIESWHDCGLSEKIIDVLKHENWTKPFAIQRQAIPCIMSGRDLIGVAKTGSGKTLAYLIPLLRHVTAQRRVASGEGPIALILIPTRELAVQINNEIKKFANHLKVEAACLYGGTEVGDQISQVRRGVEIVVGTPGRLIDVLSARGGKSLPLSRVTFVVLDEADRLFDLGFEPQVERIVNNVRPDRQTVMFSATFPDHVANLARNTLKKDSIYLVVGGGVGNVSPDIEQHIELFETDDEKFLRLLQLLGEHVAKGNILIFCDTQSKCDDIYMRLERNGYSALSLHAGKDQADRDFTIKDFKDKKKTILVATGVAGRGLDVSDLNLVVNYNCPNHLEEYVHRVGRTGRAGKKGLAHTFVLKGDDDQYCNDLRNALKGSHKEVPKFLDEMADEYNKKVRSGVAKKRKSGYKTKGFTFDESEDEDEEGDYSVKLKKMKKAYAKEFDETGEILEEDELNERSKVEENFLKDLLDETKDDLTKPKEEVKKETPLPSVIMTPLTFNVKPIAISSSGNQQQIVAYGTGNAAIATRQVIELSEAEKKLLSKTASVVPSMTSAPSTSDHFKLEIEINDLPLPVRIAITTKAAISQIENEFKVSVTIKGTFIPPGTAAGFGEKKLHAVIEAHNEDSVRRAYAEINKNIMARANRMSVDNAHEFVTGSSKYKI